MSISSLNLTARPPFRATKIGASIIASDGVVVGHVNGTGQQRVNTALVLAAAPEMYDALTDLRPWLENIALIKNHPLADVAKRALDGLEKADGASSQ